MEHNLRDAECMQEVLGDEDAMNEKLQEISSDPQKVALILKTSHIGGHKFAG